MDNIIAAGIFSTVLGWVGLSSRDAALAVVGGALVGLTPYLWRAGLATLEWGRAKASGADKTLIAKDRDDAMKAYNDLLKKVADNIRAKALPSMIRVVKDERGVVKDTQFVYDADPVDVTHVPDTTYQEPPSETPEEKPITVTLTPAEQAVVNPGQLASVKEWTPEQLATIESWKKSQGSNSVIEEVVLHSDIPGTRVARRRLRMPPPLPKKS